MLKSPVVLFCGLKRCKLVLSAIFLVGLSLAAVADASVAAKTKAGYLFNLTKFVEWPSLNNDTLHVCIIGSHQIVNLLGDLASRDTKGHLLQIWSAVDDPQICHILYLDRTIAGASDLLRQVRGGHVLTVSDAEGFTRQGGCIGFYTENRQIKLEINPDQIDGARLKVNALLMEIARIVR